MFHFLLLFVLINLGFLIWGRIRSGFFRDPVYNGILAIDAGLSLYSFTSDPSGHSVYTWLALGIFCGAVLVPLILGRFITDAFNNSNLSRVQRLLQIKYMFQPSVDVARQITENKKFLKAYRGEVSGIVREIEQELMRSKDSLQTQFLLESLAEINIFAGQWAEGIAVYRKRIGGPDPVVKPSFFVTLARAAIEVGDWDLLWEAYLGLMELEAPVDDPLIRKSVFYIQVMILSAYGKYGTLKKLFTPLHKGDPLFPLVPKRYWYGLSLMSAGRIDEAREILDFPVKFKDMAPSFYNSARERMASGFTPPPAPEPDRRAHLARIREEMKRISREKPMAMAIPWVGKGLVFLTAAVFAFQLVKMGMMFEFRGAEAMKELFWIGGNFRHRSIAYGEYWRLFTAVFLHGGFIHVFFNLYVIWIFAPLLEVHYGRLRFLLIALLSGVGGNAISAYIHPSGVSVGISGTVFGLVGAMLIMLIVHRDRFPREWRKRQLSMLVLLLIINVIIGLSMEIIDNSAHGGGLVAGMVLALALGGQMDQKNRQKILTWALALVTAGIVAYSAWGLYTFNHDRMAVPVTMKAPAGGVDLTVKVPRYWELEYLRAENLPVAPGHPKPKIPFLYDPFCSGESRLIFFTREHALQQLAQAQRAFGGHDPLKVEGWDRWRVQLGQRKGSELHFYFREFSSKTPVLIQVLYGSKCARSTQQVLGPILKEGGISGSFAP